MRDQRQTQAENVTLINEQCARPTDDLGKRVQELMERIGRIRSGHATDADTNHDTDDSVDDNADDDDGGDGANGYCRQDSGVTVRCKNCGYQWQPKRKPEEIRQCPRCNNRKWKGENAT